MSTYEQAFGEDGKFDPLHNFLKWREELGAERVSILAKETDYLKHDEDLTQEQLEGVACALCNGAHGELIPMAHSAHGILMIHLGCEHTRILRVLSDLSEPGLALVENALHEEIQRRLRHS